MNRGLFISAATVLLLAGCSPFTVNEPGPERYRLDAGAGVAAVADKLPGGLVIAAPILAPALDTDRIVVFRGGRQVDHFAGAVWVVPLGRLIHAALIDALEQVRGEPADPALVRRPEWLLRLAVRDFQAVYPERAGTGPPALEVTLTLALVNAATGETVARTRISRTDTAEANHIRSVTAGLNRLLLEAFADGIAGLNWSSVVHLYPYAAADRLVRPS